MHYGIKYSLVIGLRGRPIPMFSLVRWLVGWLVGWLVIGFGGRTTWWKSPGMVSNDSYWEGDPRVSKANQIIDYWSRNWSIIDFLKLCFRGLRSCSWLAAEMVILSKKKTLEIHWC